MSPRPDADGVKRAADILFAACGLVVTSPVALAAAVAIKLDSPGPVFFRQERVGRDGRPFRIHKFRSMRTTTTGPSVSTSTDARITRVGRLLRRTKIDEIPQLLDVLRGTMSVVGPRPEVPEYVAQWPADRRDVILSVRPGITDPASLEFRHEAEILARQDDPEDYYVRVLLPRKVDLYVDYVRSRSLAGDLRLISLTVAEVFSRHADPNPGVGS